MPCRSAVASVTVLKDEPGVTDSLVSVPSPIDRVVVDAGEVDVRPVVAAVVGNHRAGAGLAPRPSRRLHPS